MASSFLKYAIFVIAIIVCIPLALSMLTMAGLDISATIPGEVEDYTAPNLEDYVPDDNVMPWDAAVGYVTWGFSALGWIFSLILKVTLIYPILTEFFGVPSILAAPLSTMVAIAGVFFLYRLVRGQDLEE